VFYNPDVDMYLTRQAERDLAMLTALEPRPGAWGLVIGHRRGPVLFAERLFPVGALAGKHEPAAALERVSRAVSGEVVGAFIVRPGTRERRSFLGPGFFGRVLLEIRPRSKSLELKSRVVEFDGRFYFAAAGLRRPAAGKRHE
jgi:hypothetical protein